MLVDVVVGRPIVRASASLAAVALVLATASAFADVTKDQCIESNGQAQSLRRNGKFGAAREQLRICDDATCPRIVRDDCVRRLDELDRNQPTIVFEAKDASGRDLAAVKVTVDGQPLAGSLNGAALAVDPGEHAFTFEVEGRPPTTQTFVLHEADKSRRERVVLGGASPSGASQGVPSPTEAAPATAETTPSSRPSTAKVVGFVFAGVGVVGIGLGSFFGVQAVAKNNDASCDAQNVCNDPQSRRDAIHVGNASTIGFVAGGAFLAGGIALVLVAGKPANATSLRLAPWLTAGGAGTAVAGDW
jgi:hypothetical protein